MTVSWRARPSQSSSTTCGQVAGAGRSAPCHTHPLSGSSLLLSCIYNSAIIPPMVARATHEEEWFKLSPQQRAAWSGFIRAHASIVKELDAELQDIHGLPLSSYDVLVQLSLAPDGRMQMFELAEAVHLSRSGLTRLVDRLERQ